MADERILDPERHLKRLQKVFGVSKKIQELALSSIKSDPTAEQLKKEAAALENAKLLRRMRHTRLDSVHRQLIEIAAEHMNLSPDEIIEGIIDEDNHIDIIDHFLSENGSRSLFFYYDYFSHPPKGIKCWRLFLFFYLNFNFKF